MLTQKNEKYFQGFTLIELLFTILIISLLCVLSLPSLETFLNRTLHDTETIRFYQNLQFARAEAIKRQRNIALCPSDDLKNCNTNWSKGYIVYLVNPKEKELHPHAILRVHRNSTLFQIDTPSLRTIEYTKEGRCLSRGSLYIHRKGKIQQKIVLYDSGRARMETYGNQI